MSKVIPIVLLCIVCSMVTACGGEETKAGGNFPPPDTTLNSANAFNDLFLDSAVLENYLADTLISDSVAHAIRGFYASRNMEYAWFAKGRPSEYTLTFWTLVKSYMGLTSDSSFIDTSLSKVMDGIIEDSLYITKMPQKKLATTDMALTRQFFSYATVAYEGNMEPTDIQWFIPKKKINALSLLDSLMAHRKPDDDGWLPVNPYYLKLKKALAQYRDIQKAGGWDSIVYTGMKNYKTGDSADVIRALKIRLITTGDLNKSDSSAIYDSALRKAVYQVRANYGLMVNDRIDEDLVKELNVPVERRIAQMLINLERMKWLPDQTLPEKIVINIPEFTLHIFNGRDEVLSMPVVVGKSGSGTVIFNDVLKYVVFSPYWNVPRSIVKNEIVPAMRRNSGYLRKNNMEQTGTAGGLPVIRQKPGPRNALGRVKFLFPNNYNIYFHDTPAKDLFNREKRAFSHGCIRLAEPEKMAQYVLRDQPEWTDEKIREAMQSGNEKWVPVKNPIPVYITYFTTWVDENGNLNFRNDIYGHDKKMAAKLFTGYAEAE